MMRRKWRVIFSSACWLIWRQRNTWLFENKKQPTDLVEQWIVRQATLWERFCTGTEGRPGTLLEIVN